MTRGTFTKALDNIDQSYVSEALNYKDRSHNKKTLVLKIAAAAACFAVVLAGVLAVAMRKTPGNETVGVGQQKTIGQAEEKETTGHRIGMKYYPFYKDKKMTLKVFMSQHDPEGLDGYPVFEVYQGFPENATGINVYKEDHGVTVNGSEKRYEKRFTTDDLGFLCVSYDEDVFDGHSETVTLDFSKFDPDEAVSVTISYGFFYYSGNPYNQSRPDNSWCGQRTTLNFYIGEKGIAVSSNSTEDALAVYENTTGDRPGLWDHIDEINRAGESSSGYHSIKEWR